MSASQITWDAPGSAPSAASTAPAIKWDDEPVTMTQKRGGSTVTSMSPTLKEQQDTVARQQNGGREPGPVNKMDELKNFGTAAAETAGGVIGAPIAAGVMSAVGPTVAGFAAKHPIVTRMIASEAISQARHIPYVGKLIPPYSEMLPFIGGGGSPEAEPTPEPGPVYPGANLPEAPPVAVRQARPLAEGGGHAPIPPPEAALGKIPVRIATPVTNNPELPYGGSFDQEPVAVTPQQRGPIPGSPEDIAETKAIQEQSREIGEREDRQRQSQIKSDWFARNAPVKTKGELTGTAKAPSNPIAGKRMDYAEAGGKRGPIANPPGDEDLTPILKKSLAAAKKAKSRSD